MAWLKKLAISMLVLAGFVSIPSTVYAADYDIFGSCTGADCAVVKEDRLGMNSNNAVLKVIQVVLGALGSIAILMIVIAGIRFATSQGDPAAVTSAKKTVLYSVIGLVVAMLASGIVLFVTEYFT